MRYFYQDGPALWPGAQGRALLGERCRAGVPPGHWQTTTLVAALSLAGIKAPMTLDGAMHGAAFLACRAGTGARAASWRRRHHGLVPAPKMTGIREAIEARGACLLYLPPYSPDFNAIEMAFPKIKALLRKAAARTLDDLWEAIRQAIDAISPREAANCFTAAGY